MAVVDHGAVDLALGLLGALVVARVVDVVVAAPLEALVRERLPLGRRRGLERLVGRPLDVVGVEEPLGPLLSATAFSSMG